ncbi:MAG TPA: serine/threonine-protein kinase [Gemmatimonadales bacterium]
MLRSDERRGESIGERYQIEREIGRGGMATVYLARDVVRESDVAVKVLLPDLAAAVGAERFRREIAIERELDHPAILGVLDSGEDDGRLFYVMPYVAGESLRARMDREGQLPVEDALRIAVQVARGLAYAHGHGILHRDVKPENVLLDGERVLLADFGIARALSHGAEQRLTQTGVTLGTPRYMSPEQSSAERQLDGRSDLYSLGCVLYEMLAGQPPFTGPNAQAITARHHLEAVPSITVIRPAVSDQVEDIVMCALAKSPSDRYPGVAAFADAMEHCMADGCATARRTAATARFTSPVVTPARRRRLVVLSSALAAAAVLVVAGGAAFVWRGQATERAVRSALEANDRVAVLYFRDASPGGQLGYLADALSETLMDELSRAGLDVVSRAGVLPFRGGNVSRDSVAAAVGDPGLIVDGTVEERDGGSRLSLVLVDPRSDVVLASRAFDLPPDGGAGGDSMGIGVGNTELEEIEEFLRMSIGREVSLRSERVAAGGDVAWTLQQRAEHVRKEADAAWQKGDTAASVRALEEADSLAARAAELAPRWAEPLVLRGELAFRRAGMETQPAAARPWLVSAAEYADGAFARDARSAGAHELRGTVTYEFVLRGLTHDTAEVTRRVASAAQALRAATELAPRRATAWVRLSEVAYRQLNVLAANIAARRAYEADAYLTAAPDVLWRLFATSYDLDQPQDASDWCATGGERFPDDERFLRCQLVLMTMRGGRVDVPHAWRILEELTERTPPPERPFQERYDRILLAAALGRAGMADSARAVLATTHADRDVDPRGELRGYEAFARVVIGDRDRALALLTAYLHDNPEHREGFSRINAWWWQDLKADPRFQLLVAGGQ